MQENKIRRAGLDYQDLAFVKNYESWIDFTDSNKNKSIACLSSKGDKEYWNEELNNFDFLLFGPESVGLPDEIREKYLNLTIPMKERSRSINLANSVSIVMFEAIRQANVK